MSSMTLVIATRRQAILTTVDQNDTSLSKGAFARSPLAHRISRRSLTGTAQHRFSNDPKSMRICRLGIATVAAGGARARATQTEVSS